MGKIIVSGEGKVTTAPDVGFLNVTITAQGKKSKEAREENNKVSAEVLSKLKGDFKIAPKDLKTLGLQTYPQYEVVKKGVKKAPKIISYIIIHVIAVKIRDLSLIDDIIDGVSDVGEQVNVGQIDFGIDDETRNKLTQGVRKLAFADAKSKAELYCKEAGIVLGEIESLQENSYRGGGYQKHAIRAACAMPESTLESVGVQVQPLLRL